MKTLGVAVHYSLTTVHFCDRSLNIVSLRRKINKESKLKAEKQRLAMKEQAEKELLERKQKQLKEKQLKEKLKNEEDERK